VYEWNFGGKKSSIAECQIEYGGKITGSSGQYYGNRLMTSSPEISISPDRSAKITSKIIEYRRVTDMVWSGFYYPTKNPEVDVSIPDGFDYEINLGPTVEETEKLRFAARHTLKGTFFPGHRIIVSWWPKAEPQLTLPAGQEGS
jgi:hypothetical protein